MLASKIASPGKYLTFSLSDELYGLEILRVQEIVGMAPIARVPRLPEFVAGVMNLRGRVIPVIDLRLAFGLSEVATTERTCIVVVRIERDDRGTTVMGMIVDEVSDVLSLPKESIEPTPDFGAGVDTPFITGVGRADAHVVLLVDIDRVLSAEQLAVAVDPAPDGPAPPPGEDVASGGAR